MADRNDAEPKERYEKPRLRVIELTADEVLSSGCKTGPADGSGPVGNGCANPLCSMTPGS